MDLIPQNIDGTIVLDVGNVCTSHETDCRNCSDIGGCVHNWLMVTDLRYVIIDFQDEKEICHTFITELLQLRKRLAIPFLFTGVTARPKEILYSYGIGPESNVIFELAEEAIKFLVRDYPTAISHDFSQVKFNEAITSLRSRQLQRTFEPEEITEDDI